MKDFKIKVKDVKEFVKTSFYTYASGQGKVFEVALHAGPNVPRYVVKNGNTTRGFTKVGEAVEFFNEG